MEERTKERTVKGRSLVEKEIEGQRNEERVKLKKVREGGRMK